MTITTTGALGASGGVCAVLFAFILIDPLRPLQLFFSIDCRRLYTPSSFLACMIYMSRRGGRPMLNHDAHLWGLIGGIVFTIIARPSVVNTFLNELAHPRFN